MSNQPEMSGPIIRSMIHKLKMIQAIASNMANANSIGYQRQIPESLSFESVLNKAATRDTTQGQIKNTGNSLDLAVEGNAYFLIETKDGVTTTRDGRFQLNNKGELATYEGNPLVIVEKTDKPISLANSFNIKVNDSGEIEVDGERYGRIAMQIEDNRPVKVHQGFVEGSNVDTMNEMLSLTMAFRSFEASEKALSMMTSIDKELIDRYGRNV